MVLASLLAQYLVPYLVSEGFRDWVVITSAAQLLSDMDIQLSQVHGQGVLGCLGAFASPDDF
jgi:hypothetical protein